METRLGVARRKNTAGMMRLSVALALCATQAHALDNGLGKLPGLGWNSDYCTNCSVRLRAALTCCSVTLARAPGPTAFPPAGVPTAGPAAPGRAVRRGRAHNGLRRRGVRQAHRGPHAHRQVQGDGRPEDDAAARLPLRQYGELGSGCCSGYACFARAVLLPVRSQYRS